MNTIINIAYAAVFVSAIALGAFILRTDWVVLGIIVFGSMGYFAVDGAVKWWIQCIEIRRFRQEIADYEKGVNTK